VRNDISDASYACHTLCMFILDACQGTAGLVWAELGDELSLPSRACASPKECTVTASCPSQCEQLVMGPCT